MHLSGSAGHFELEDTSVVAQIHQFDDLVDSIQFISDFIGLVVAQLLGVDPTLEL